MVLLIAEALQVGSILILHRLVPAVDQKGSLQGVTGECMSNDLCRPT